MRIKPAVITGTIAAAALAAAPFAVASATTSAPASGPASGSASAAIDEVHEVFLPGAAPACTYEDGSGQEKCVWDAVHRGNGEGRSAYIWHGGQSKSTVVYVPHWVAHQMVENWNRWN